MLECMSVRDVDPALPEARCLNVMSRVSGDTLDLCQRFADAEALGALLPSLTQLIRRGTGLSLSVHKVGSRTHTEKEKGQTEERKPEI